MLEIIVAAVGAILLGVLAYFAGRTKKLNNAALDALWIAVQHTSAEIVDDFKKKSEDGQLTSEEAKQARDYAVQKALELAKGPVKDLLLSWGKPKLEAIVHDLAAKIKPAEKKEG